MTGPRRPPAQRTGATWSRPWRSTRARPYRAAVREHLPHATLVVDHFHVVQLANQVLSSVRRRVTAKLRGRRVRKDDPEYGLRRRLMRNREDLTGEKVTDMWNRLVDLGQAGDEILAAGSAHEELS